MTERFEELSNTVKSFSDTVETSSQMIENIEEKLYDFEVGKKNNLIFYGLPSPRNESRHSLTHKIQNILQKILNITRPISLESVSRYEI